MLNSGMSCFRAERGAGGAQTRGHFTRLGLQPKSFKLIVVKSGYLSPELSPLANPSLMALSDGSINQDIVHLPANKYRVPTYPFCGGLAVHAEGDLVGAFADLGFTLISTAFRFGGPVCGAARCKTRL